MRKLFVLLIAVIFTFTLCGCTSNQNPDGRYNAEFAYDPQQYMLFVNKELQAPLNQMSDILSALGKFKNGEVSEDGLHKLIRSAHSTITDCSQSIYLMRPPHYYQEEAERIIGYLDDIRGIYAELLELLSNENPNAEAMSAMSDKLHEGYLLVTSEANAYWK